MNDPRNLKLPSALRAARTHRGLSQKALAVELQIDPSRLCAMEHGRRQVVDADMEDRVRAAFASFPKLVDELEWAIRHDRVMVVLAQLGMTGQLAAVSAFMNAVRTLDADEVRGLVAQLDRLVEGKKRLVALAASAIGAEGSAP